MKRARTPPPIASEWVDRFWSNVTKSADGCWEWTGSRDGNNRVGYGQLSINDQKHKAHRISWMLANGAAPDEMSVCHHCDNPGCVRPDHLFVATHAENMRDMAAKGRHFSKTNPSALARGAANGTRTHPETLRRGTNNPASKLTEADVIVILDSRGLVPMTHLARRFGVSHRTVWNILNGKVWLDLVERREKARGKR